MVYTKFCKCGRILTLGEMDKNKNPTQACVKCKERHVRDFNRKFDITKEG